MRLVPGIIHVVIDGTHSDGRGRRGGSVTLKETLASLLFLVNLNAVADKMVLEESRIKEDGATVKGVRTFADEAWLTRTGGRVAVDAMEGSVIQADGVHIGIHGDNKRRERRRPVGRHIVGRLGVSSGSVGRGGTAAAGVGRNGTGRGRPQPQQYEPGQEPEEEDHVAERRKQADGAGRKRRLVDGYQKWDGCGSWKEQVGCPGGGGIAPKW